MLQQGNDLLIFFSLMVRSTENRDNRRSAKARILEVYEMDGNWKALAENLSIPKTTLYRWISKGNQPDTRGGPRNCKVKQVHLDFIQALVISERIEAQFGFKLSKSTVAKHLDMMTYALKAVRFVPERANSIENKNKRSLFCSKLLNYQSTGKPILFMNETNFNLHISRRDGRSLKGRRCNVVSAGTQGANIHVIGCIGLHGLVYHEIQRGSFRKESAQSWMRECLRVVKRQYGGPVVMVVDNAPCHSNIEEVFSEEEFLGCEVLKLAPYSPMFNPIEQVWSLIKAYVKQELAAKIVSILAMERKMACQLLNKGQEL